ncbi:MAG TPA: hypothetical protein VFB90_02575 [Dehalococcoidia bacterium]|nr:hypothetical protein [Dehalococcoidia bacterium]
MHCSRCETEYTMEDNYCRQCGASLRIQRLPVRREENLPERWQSGPPAIVKGATAVAAGAVGQWALKALVRHLISSRAKPSGKSLVSGKKQRQLPEAEYALTETVMLRKVTVRR